jgi:hypothetical protein
LKRREDWFESQLDFDPQRLVFIDETWASTNIARTHGRCLRGERLRVGVLDHAPHVRPLVARQVVDLHDVTRPGLRNQDLRHIGLESLSVDRPVENHGAIMPSVRRPATKVAVLPMAVRDVHPQPLSPQACHVGRSSGLVDEDEALRIEVELSLEPGRCGRPSRRADLAPRRAPSFYEDDLAELDEALQRGNADPDAILRQHRFDLHERV